MSDRGPYWELKRKPSAIPPPPNPTLVEIHEWVQPSHCHQHDSTLRHGHLLRWMDIAACLSAEKHAKVPCVTVSMDDITFDTTVSVGHVVVLRAVVNRAFSSSLEVGINVQYEDPFSGERNQVCNAYSVFVARPKDGSKIKLSSVSMSSEEEHREHLLAAERRRMRVTYAKDIEKIINGLKIEEISPATPLTNGKVLHVKDTQVHTTKIVLPVHANHHGTTFGGQIMEWGTDIATISALRLCRCQLVLESIESFHFRGPSYMGERVSLHSSVNKVFSNKRFEVGVRVEGYAVGGEKKHINSAFFVFRPNAEDSLFPQLVANSKIEEGRAAKAIARHCLSLDRKAIQFHDLQVSLSNENVYDLIVKNTTKLMTNFSLRKWEVLQSCGNGRELRKYQTSQNLILRLTDTLEGIKASDAFRKLTVYKNRPKWDFICKHVKEYWCVTEDDSVLHLVFKPAREGELPKDFVMLASKRKPLENSSHKFYMVAFSSVLCPDIPPLKDYERSNVISSGYFFEDVTTADAGIQKCHFTYIHQVGSSVLPFLAKDVIGVSTLLEKVYMSLKQHLLK